jgi:hypothetical protein
MGKGRSDFQRETGLEKLAALYSRECPENTYPDPEKKYTKGSSERISEKEGSLCLEKSNRWWD